MKDAAVSSHFPSYCFKPPFFLTGRSDVTGAGNNRENSRLHESIPHRARRRESHVHLAVYNNASLNRAVYQTRPSHRRCFTPPRRSRRSWGRKRRGGERRRRGKKSGKALASPAPARNYSAAVSAGWESRDQEDRGSLPVVSRWPHVLTQKVQKATSQSGTKQEKRPGRRYSVNWKGNLIFDKLEDNITVLWNINNFNIHTYIYLIPLRKPTVLYLVYWSSLNPFLFCVVAKISIWSKF